jgi:hypothetical protein
MHFGTKLAQERRRGRGVERFLEVEFLLYRCLSRLICNLNPAVFTVLNTPPFDIKERVGNTIHLNLTLLHCVLHVLRYPSIESES